MAARTDMGALALAALKDTHTVKPADLGDDVCLKARGITIRLESGTIEGIGHFCVMRMKTLLNLMNMETLVLAPTHVDLPLFNMDWMQVAGAQTQIVELYDNQLEPWPDACQAEFQSIAERNADLPDAPVAERWFSEIMYPCSFHKKGRGLAERFSLAAQDCLASYIAQFDVLPKCDSAAKKEKVCAFAQRLYDEGGPAVDTIVKLFGAETARRIVLNHMYGVEGI